jgi:trk system potassium uptake protein TrkA
MSTVSLVGRVRQVEIGDGYVVQEIAPPRSFVGRTLRELDVRARHGIQVIFVKHLEEGEVRLLVPQPDHRVATGDTLIVAGPREAADALAYM